jgi:hypothetical protein
MDSLDCLPLRSLTDKGSFSRLFLAHGLTEFRAACQWVKQLPYGSNSSHEDSRILFVEQQGTCTTKHGAIAHLAQEQNLPVYKTLGFYRLTDEIVTGINALLTPCGLPFIPQIHCFLAYESFRVDLTEGNCNGKNKIIEDYDFVVQVKPDLTLQEERQYYSDYLQRYFNLEPRLKQVEPDLIFQLLEECNRKVKYQCSVMSGQVPVS